MVEIVPFVDEGLGNSSYLVNLGDGQALVVDPSRDPRPYRGAAEARGLTVAFTAETHLHADFVSGSRELAQADGATIIAPQAGLAYPHRGLADKDEMTLGGFALRAIATPGHTPEHLSYLLLEGNRPLALFTGGSLLVGAVARTDLIAPEQSEPLARALYRSMHERLLTLSDDLAVYPTHGAGSFCSAPAGGDRVTTIGRERHTNPLLAARDEDSFVRLLFAGLGSYPAYFRRLREVNRKGAKVFGPEPPALPPLEPAEVRRLVEEGAELIDVRPMEAFALGHIPGALSIALRPAFASWLGWMVPETKPLVFVLGPDQDRADLAQQCLKIGYERLAGELAGGMDAWRAAGYPETRIPLVGTAALPGTNLLDVRQADEFRAGSIPAAVHVELGSLAGRTTDVPSGPLTVYCGHGERAMTGASILERAGRRGLAVLDGGYDAWTEATAAGASR